MEAKKRYTGLDLLRIISMFMIVMLHALSKGGALWDTERFTASWFGSWGIEALCLCATNCYVLISGYFLSQSEEMKWKKVIRLLAEVWSYSLVIFALMLVFGYRPSLLEAANSIVPFYSKSYWFINSYILMYLLHPYVNRLINRLRKREFKRLLVILLVFFSLAQTVTPYLEWTMDESWGYGIIWFECLYLIAAYIRRFGIPAWFTWIKCLIGYIICAASMLGCRYVLLRLLAHFNKNEAFAEMWYAYNSIPCLLGSICLFLIFLQINSGKDRKFLSVTAGATLGVYLLHEQGFLRDYLWREILHLDSWTNKNMQIPMVIAYAFGVFLICLAISMAAKAVAREIGKSWVRKSQMNSFVSRKSVNRSLAVMIILNIIGIATVILLVIKAPYGFGTADECYYLITPLRLVKGDAMMVDEWFIAQLFGFAVYPLMKLYMVLAGGTTGIVLAFRYIYIALKVLASIYIYRRLKRKADIITAFAATLLFLLYTPFDIMGLSYNTIGMIALCMSLTAAATLKKNEVFTPILTGFLYAIAVLCCPYLIVIFVIYSVIVFICVCFNTARKKVILRGLTWIKLTSGAATAAAAFGAFILSRASAGEVLDVLPHILGNPTHQGGSLIDLAKGYLKTVIIWDKKRLVMLAALLAICILYLCIKSLSKIRWAVFICAVLVTFLYVFLPGYPHDMANHFILPVNILGFVCFILSEKRRYGMFCTMWAAGIIYSIAIFLSSNQEFYVISSATMVSAIASLVFISDLIWKMIQTAWRKKAEPENTDEAEKIVRARAAAVICACLGAAVVLAQLGAVSVSAAFHCFWDDNSYRLENRVDFGCEKGVITSEEYAVLYQSLWDETSQIRNQTQGRVMYMTADKLWLMLDDEKKAGTCFSYYEGTDEYKAKELSAYFDMYPEKKADHYFFENGIDTHIMAEAFELNEDLIETTASGDHIYISR